MKTLCGYAAKCIILLLAAQFGSLFADNILEMRRLKALRAQAQQKVNKLQRQNNNLVAQAKALQADPFYVELALRQKLRYVRPDEVQLWEASQTMLCERQNRPPLRREKQPRVRVHLSLDRRPLILARNDARRRTVEFGSRNKRQARQ